MGMPDETVFRVQHAAVSDGKHYLAISDMIFRDGRPMLVLKWGGVPDNEFPLEIVRLDPTQLQEFPAGPVTHFYHGEIDASTVEPPDGLQ
jgi:hypothetical protein